MRSEWTGLALVAFLAACAGTTGDSGGSTGGDGGGLPECNTDNEDCGPGTCGGEGPDMLPGADCMACHSEGNYGEDEGVFFTASGTVFTDLFGSGQASGATVRVIDSLGTVVELQTTLNGNFYTEDALVPPFGGEVEVDGTVLAMVTPVATGNCDSCHRCDGAAGGKLHVP